MFAAYFAILGAGFVSKPRGLADGDVESHHVPGTSNKTSVI